MCSKIKKVLVSLALASSLALAPMNVSAENPVLTQSNQTATTEVLVTGSQLAVRYVVEVPEKVTIDLDNRVCDTTSVKLVDAEDFANNQVLKITPSFVAASATKKIKVQAEGESGKIIEDESMTITSFGISNDLLKFGTYEGDPAALNEGSNIAQFTMDQKGTTVTIPNVVDKSLANKIKRKIPTPDGAVTDPKIAADQSIGTINYSCALEIPGSK